MGKYLPVIKTAECGSLTKAAHVLGYTQPSLGYIINNIEDELGVKLFYRDQRGVTLTENGPAGNHEADRDHGGPAAGDCPGQPGHADPGGDFPQPGQPVDALRPPEIL